MTYLFLLYIPITAFMYRWRGMSHSWGTTVNRLMYGSVIGLECLPIAYVWHMPLWVAGICGVMAFLGAIEGHASAQGNTWKQHWQMGLITTVMLILVLTPFVHFHHYLVVLFPLGFLSAPAYWLGYKIPWTFKPWCVPGDTSWPEFLTGAMAFGLPLAILGIWGVYHIG